jgi:hypothetical protein
VLFPVFELRNSAKIYRHCKIQDARHGVTSGIDTVLHKRKFE